MTNLLNNKNLFNEFSQKSEADNQTNKSMVLNSGNNSAKKNQSQGNLKINQTMNSGVSERSGISPKNREGILKTGGVSDYLQEKKVFGDTLDPYDKG